MKKIFTMLLLIQIAFAFAQNPTGISGKVVDAKTQRPLPNVVVTIQNSNFSQLTDVSGNFSFKDLPVGNQLLSVKTQGYKEQLIQVDVVASKMFDMGTIVAQEDITQEQQLSLITITESDLGDDNSGSESTAGLLQASRDPFQQTAAFNWGQARFRIRGLDNEYGTTMINGVTMNKLYDGRPQWGNWGGLNDATRNQEFTTGSAPSDYTFGGILGTQEINTRASIYRPGTRISFSSTNTNYNWRAQGTHASGMNKDGWAYVISASRRWAVEGYFEGTDYSANSFFASVEKRINKHHSLNFTSIYAQNSRGKNSPNTKEVSDIAGIKYNSYWGWQDGKKRNARDKDVEEPIFMLGHYWKINDKTNLNTNVTFQQGTIGNSRIDFQGANNPDPTYYHNLPSYYTSAYVNNVFVGNTPDYIADSKKAKFLNNRQIDWNAMYYANSQTAAGNSVYVLYEDRTDDTQYSANTVLNSQLADNIGINAGATFRTLKSHNHQNLLDLLGGSYYEELDTFGTTYPQTQPDLNNPDRIVREGDSYGYNYNLLATNFDAFTQFKFTYRKIDFYLAQTFSHTEYQREGLYRNGYYPTNSFGKSNNVVFENFGFKGGLTWKVTGQHFFTVNALHETKAPTMRNVFPNARVSNNILAGAVSEDISSADISYNIRTPKFKARLTAYWAGIKNATETSFFFAEGIFDGSADGGDEDAFVAETVTNIEKRHIGGELGMEYQITSTIKVTASAAYGQFTYNNNPNVTLTNDALATLANTSPTTDFGTANLKNYRLPGTPQEAYSLGLEYRDPKFWWIGANANYLASNYMDVAPLLRTDHFFQNPADPFGLPFTDVNDATAKKLLQQEKFDPFYLVNVTGGKSWRIKGNTVGFFASVNNVFDVTYKTGGFEQARNGNYRELNQDASTGTPAFAPKYFYGFGRTYFVNLYIQF